MPTFFNWPPSLGGPPASTRAEQNQPQPQATLTLEQMERLYQQQRDANTYLQSDASWYAIARQPVDSTFSVPPTNYTQETVALGYAIHSEHSEPMDVPEEMWGTLNDAMDEVELEEVNIGEGNMPIVRAAKKKVAEDGSVEEKKVKKKKDLLVEVVKEMDTIWSDFLMRLKVSFGSHSMGREDWDMFFSENCFFGPDYFIEALSPKRNPTGKQKTPILFFKTKAAMNKAHDMFIIRRNDFVRYTFEEPVGRCFMTQFMKENIFFSVDLYGSPEEVMKKTANLTLEDCFYEVSSGRYHVNTYLLNKQVSFNSVEDAGDCAFSTTVLDKAFEFMQRGFAMSKGSYQWYINGLIGQENKNAIIRFKRQNNIRLPSDENDGVSLTNIAHPSADEMPIIPGSGPRLRPTRRSMAQTRGALPEPNSNF